MLGLRALVLNSNYMPISLFPIHSIPVEDAVVRVFNETCHVVFEYDRDILTPTLEMKWPSVIARNDNLRIKEKVKLRRESLFYRDHGICVYCEKQLSLGEVTFDHVHPRARGGMHSWDNVVCACISCNIKKGSNLPVGEWSPKIKPYEPNYFQLLSRRKKFPITVPDESWTHFLGDWEAEVKVAA
jgi:5-methylcytosine-specific restriction endonuclease McrA